MPEIPGELKYVGKPSQEIDENWSKILSEGEKVYAMIEAPAAYHCVSRTNVRP